MAAGPKRDIFAEFYDALEETGEYCAFEIGRYSTGMSAPEWTHFRHQDCDGPRAFAKVLHTRTSLEVDIGTSPNPPSFWTLFIAWIRLFFVDVQRRAPLRWRRFDRSWRPSPSTRSRPPAVAWSLFSREETIRMAMLAKARGVSLQSWLLWALKESIVPELVPGKGLVAWHVPVNMHGAFPSSQDHGNSNFSLEVMFPPDADPAAVHKAIRQELRLRRHWVIAKWVFSFAWMITPWLLRQLVKLAALQPPWQGSFSSSGTVGYAEDAYGIEEWYIGLNPVVRFESARRLLLRVAGTAGAVHPDRPVAHDGPAGRSGLAQVLGPVRRGNQPSRGGPPRRSACRRASGRAGEQGRDDGRLSVLRAAGAPAARVYIADLPSLGGARARKRRSRGGVSAWMCS